MQSKWLLALCCLVVLGSWPVLAQGYQPAKCLGSEYFKHDNPVTGSVFSPDGKYVLSGADKNIVFWEVATGAKVRTWSSLSYAVSLLAFSPDSGLLGIEDKC